MGYDKPDLGFVVHYQAPGSVIAYYQQVGRAGRGVEHAEVVLLRGARGPRGSRTSSSSRRSRARELVERVLEALDARGRGRAPVPALTGDVNLGRGRIEAMLKVLDVEGAVGARGHPLGRRPGRGLALRRRPLRRRSPRCAGASRRPWPPSAPTGAA